MRTSIKITIVCLLSLSFCSCAILSREQVKSLRETANNLDRRVKLNEQAKKYMAEDLGSDSKHIRILEQNSELQQSAAATIRNLVGSGND